MKQAISHMALTLLHEGGVAGLGGGADGSGALGETRDVAKGVHGRKSTWDGCDEWGMGMEGEERREKEIDQESENNAEGLARSRAVPVCVSACVLCVCCVWANTEELQSAPLSHPSRRHHHCFPN